MKTITIEIGNNQLIVDENWNTSEGRTHLGWVHANYNHSFNYGVQCGDIIVTDSDGRRLKSNGWCVEWVDIMPIVGYITKETFDVNGNLIQSETTYVR